MKYIYIFSKYTNVQSIKNKISMLQQQGEKNSIVLLLNKKDQQQEQIIVCQQQKVAASQQIKAMKKDNPPQKIVMVQKNIRACLARVILKKKLKRLSRRKRIIEELIQSQENYIRDLGFIVSDFKMKLTSNNILTPQKSHIIFSNIDQIRRLHEDFFITLHNQFVNYSHYQVLFADVLKIILFFRIYIEYLNNFPAACELIEEEQKKNEDFTNFLIQISRSKKYKFLRIQDFLIKPVQRLPKYVLLLKQILKYTEIDHPDYKNIAKALQKFEQVNTNNNQKLAQISNNYKLLQIAESLKLPQGIVTPSVQFITEETVQIYSPQYNSIYSNCVLYLLNNAAIIARRTCWGKVADKNSMFKKHKASNQKQKLDTIIPIKHGTSLIKSQDQCIYRNSFTLQSPDGESCTFICATKEDMNYLFYKLKNLIEKIQQQTIQKLKNLMDNDYKAFKSHISMNQSFLMNLTIIDLIPDVTILGTTERNDKLLKYTVYIIEIKIKMIRQKLFLRFSEIIELEKYVRQEFKNINMKQTLITSSWLNNHQQRTIEERKINIERFLKELLSKPQVITNGSKILIKMGLPGDFYELPKKMMENKNNEDFMLKNSLTGIAHSVNEMSTKFKKKVHQSTREIDYPSFLKTPQRSKISNPSIKMNNNLRVSIFKQQKIQEEEEKILEKQFEQQQHDSSNQDEEQNEQTFKKSIKNSFKKGDTYNVNNLLKSNMLTNLTIQDLLKANQIDLGHYTRYSEQAEQDIQGGRYSKAESSISRNTAEIMKEINHKVQITVHILAIEKNYFTQPQSDFEPLIENKKNMAQRKTSQSLRNSKPRQSGSFVQRGFKTIEINAKKYQKIQCLIPQICKILRLKYYKDFRLFIEKQFAYRVVDDDQLVYKIIDEIQKSGSILVFKKMIFIDNQTEEKQIKLDRVRLSLVAGQIMNQVKKGRYFLSYEKYLKFAVLSSIVYGEYIGKKNSTSSLNKNIFAEKQKSRATLKGHYSADNMSDFKNKSFYSLHEDQAYLTILAREAKTVIFPKYCSLSGKDKVWVQDFVKTYKIILKRLFYIRDNNCIEIGNSQMQLYIKDIDLCRRFSQQNTLLKKSYVFEQKNEKKLLKNEQQTDSFISISDYDKIEGQKYRCSFAEIKQNQIISVSKTKNKAETAIKYLAMLAITKEIEYSDNDLFGGMAYSVQISQEFKALLNHQKTMMNVRSTAMSHKSLQHQDSINIAFLKEEETRNCWLVIKHDKIMLVSINLRVVLVQISYSCLKSIQTYSSCIILHLRKKKGQFLEFQSIKLKTTASYYIRDLIFYYRNYNEIRKKLCHNEDLQSSIISLAKEEMVEVGMGEVEEVIV